MAVAERPAPTAGNDDGVAHGAIPGQPSIDQARAEGLVVEGWCGARRVPLSVARLAELPRCPECLTLWRADREVSQ